MQRCLRPRFAMGILAAVFLLGGPGQTRAQAEASSVTQRHYQIPAGALAPALNRFALEAGVVMYFDPGLTEGKHTRGLRGHYSVPDGFAALLLGTGLSAEPEARGQYVLRQEGGEGGDHANPLPRVTVTGELDPRGRAYRTPGSMTIISRDQIDRMPPRNTSDVLAAVPGVHTSQSRQDPGVSVNIRGLQDFGRVNVMIDGTRQNYQQSGHGSNGQVYVDPELLAGVDISKGPSSGAGGAAVTGGMVNFRTLDVDDLLEPEQRSGGRVNATTGDNAYHFSGSVAGAVRASDNVDLMAAVSRKNVGAFKKGERGGNSGGYWHGTSQFTGQEQWSALLKGTWRFADNQSLKFSYIGLRADFDEGSNTAPGSDATDENQIHSDTFLINYAFYPGSRWWDLDASLYYTRTRNDEYRPDDPDDDYGEFDLRYETNTVGGTLVNRMEVPVGDWRGSLDLTYGGEFYHDWTRPDNSGDERGADWFAGPTPEGERSVISAFTTARLAHYDGWELTGGVRYDWFRLEGDGEMFVGRQENEDGVRPPYTLLYSKFDVARHDGFVSPTLKAAWQVANPLQLFASYGQGVRPPAITESIMWGAHIANTFPFFPNPGLEPERSRTWEVGANLNWQSLFKNGDRLRMKTAWFDTRVKNYITQGLVVGPASENGESQSLAFVNLQDEVRFYGLEWQAEYDAGGYFLEASWTRTLHDLGRGGYDPYPLGCFTGCPPTGHGDANGGGMFYLLPPVKKGTLSAGLRLLDRKLTLGARARYEDNDGRGGSAYEDVVDWTVYDAWASYQPNDRLTLRLAVDNLRDRNYAELNGLSYWIAPGRTVTGTVSLKF